MIFPVLELEQVVQVDDKTRLNAKKTYATPDEADISLIEIEPETGAGFFDVTTDRVLDYQYSTDGAKTVSLRVTTDGAPETLTRTLNIVTAADDKLFSTDAELLPYEPNILDWVRSGRNSFLDVHRAAQDRIISYLDEHKIWDVNGNRLTKDAVVDIEEVNDWSKFLTLELIFEGLSNAIDDIFAQKKLRYSKMRQDAQNRAAIRLDRDGDGSLDDERILNLRSVALKRR